MKILILVMYHAFLYGDPEVERFSRVARSNNTARGGSRNHAPTLDQQLDLGACVLEYLKEMAGADEAKTYAEDVLAVHERGSQPTVRLPYGFWRRFFHDTRRLVPTKAKQVQAKRALIMHVVRSHGAATRVALRAGRRGSSKRDRGGASNKAKAPGIAFMLLSS